MLNTLVIMSTVLLYSYYCNLIMAADEMIYSCVAGFPYAPFSQRPWLAEDLRGVLLPPDLQDPTQHDHQAHTPL